LSIDWHRDLRESSTSFRHDQDELFSIAPVPVSEAIWKLSGVVSSCSQTHFRFAKPERPDKCLRGNFHSFESHLVTFNSAPFKTALKRLPSQQAHCLTGQTGLIASRLPNAAAPVKAALSRWKQARAFRPQDPPICLLVPFKMMSSCSPC
jgi:hypothetical protein